MTLIAYGNSVPEWALLGLYLHDLLLKFNTCTIYGRKRLCCWQLAWKHKSPVLSPVPDILAQSCWGTLLTSTVQHMEVTDRDGHSQQPVQLHGTQNATSHWNLSLLTRPRKREEQAFAVCLTMQKALNETIKKSWEAFSVKIMPLLQCDCFYELHGTFDSQKHLSRGKGPNWSGKRNKWECLNLSSVSIPNCQGRKGGLSSTVLGSG